MKHSDLVEVVCSRIIPACLVINLTIIVAFTCRPNVVDVARSRDDTIEADYQEELRDPGR
jgi:hypothetical protein